MDQQGESQKGDHTMKITFMIVLLLLLLPDAAKAQWGFDVSSVEAYISDHKKQRSLLLARQFLSTSRQVCIDRDGWNVERDYNRLISC